jgi:hypothetical protein
LTKPLLRQRIEARFRDQAKVAGERELESHAEAVPPIGGNHRLGTACRRGNVPGEAGDLLGCRLQEALDVAPAGEMLPGCPQYDDANARIIVQSFEHEPELIALRHRYDVEWRPVEDDVGAFARRVDLDAKAVKRRKARIIEGGAHVGPSLASASPRSGSYSPATSLRRRSLPTGDFGTASTNT